MPDFLIHSDIPPPGQVSPVLLVPVVPLPEALPLLLLGILQSTALVPNLGNKLTQKLQCCEQFPNIPDQKSIYTNQALY